MGEDFGKEKKARDVIPFRSDVSVFLQDAEVLVTDARELIALLRPLLEEAQKHAIEDEDDSKQQDANEAIETLDAYERTYATLGAAVAALQATPLDGGALENARAKYAEVEAATAELEPIMLTVTARPKEEK